MKPSKENTVGIFKILLPCVYTIRKTLQFFRACSGFFFHKMERIISHPLLLELPYLRIKPKTQSRQCTKKWYPSPQQYLPTQPIHVYGIILPLPHPEDFTWQANMIGTTNARLLINFLLLNVAFVIQIYEMIHTFFFLVTCHRKFHVFHKSDSRWSGD